jgi:hypothetical protein
MRALAALLVLAGLAAADGLPGDLADARIGVHLAGPPFARIADGRWTVVAFWGWRCAACQVAIPDLGRMTRTPGVRLLAVHATEAADADILAAWQAHGGSPLASVVADGTILGQTRPPLPLVMLFDPAGRLRFDGDPWEAGRQLPVLMAGSATTPAGP